jgi:hypothetical protein
VHRVLLFLILIIHPSLAEVHRVLLFLILIIHPSLAEVHRVLLFLILIIHPSHTEVHRVLLFLILIIHPSHTEVHRVLRPGGYFCYGDISQPPFVQHFKTLFPKLGLNIESEEITLPYALSALDKMANLRGSELNKFPRLLQVGTLSTSFPLCRRAFCLRFVSFTFFNLFFLSSSSLPSRIPGVSLLLCSQPFFKNFVGQPGSLTYENLKSGAWTYVRLTSKKSEEAKKSL